MWVGTSEFADAAGFAVVAEIATTHGASPINTFTLMKVMGPDIWIGIWNGFYGPGASASRSVGGM